MNDQLEYINIYVSRIRDQYLLYRFAHVPVLVILYLCFIYSDKS